MADSVYLVTGGSGFLGVNLCRFLLARGRRVRSLDIAPFDYPERTAVDAILGDVRDPATVDHALKDVDIVVHCAANLPLCDANEVFSTNVDGTRRMLDGARAHGVSRFINISSTAVYGVPDHHPILESDRLHGVGSYGESKIKAEALCDAARDKSFNVTQLRPKSFVGPERLGAFELLYEWAYAGRSFPVLGRGDNLYQLLDVEDLCEAIHLCAIAEAALVNDTFNVAAKQFGTMRDNFQAVLDRAGHGRKVVSIPERPAIILLRVLERLGLSPLYQWIYETAARESFVSVDRIEKRLGFVPRHSNRDALIRNYDWYVAHRGEIAKSSGTSHRVAWKKGALRLAEHLF